jgi:hypothetical protein
MLYFFKLALGNYKNILGYILESTKHVEKLGLQHGYLEKIFHPINLMLYEF